MTDPLEAGRALDALVAERVMGLKSKIDEGYAVPTRVFARGPDLGIEGDWWGGAPEYSTDIAATWTVVEKLRLAVIPDASGGWRAGQEPFKGPHWYEVNVNDWEWAETAPLAICRAALAAVGVPT